MDQLALHVLQGKGFLEPIADWHEGTLIPAWQRDRARDSAYAIASCFSQSAKIGQSAQNRSPAEVQAHTSDATPYFGSTAFTWSGAGTPGSEPDLHRCCFAVRFAVFYFRLRPKQEFFVFRSMSTTEYSTSGLTWRPLRGTQRARHPQGKVVFRLTALGACQAREEITQSSSHLFQEREFWSSCALRKKRLRDNSVFV